MSEDATFVDHPFKRRRRRRGNFAARALLVLLFCALSSSTAFVPLPLSHPPAISYQDVSVDAIFEFQRPVNQRTRRRYRFSLLPRNANVSGKDSAKDGSSNDGKSYRIPSEQLERIKESVDIVSVIESYGLPGFQRHGNSRAKAICPFHDDHNPSMSVDGQRGMYKCFACGAGGDVFSFVREYSALQSEPMTFYQAVRHVAKEFGDPNLELDFVSSSSASRMSDEERKALNEKKQRLLLANAAAAAFYGKCLITYPAAGVARSHILERGLSPTTVKAFAMGYAPDGYFRVKGEWGKGSLVHHLRDLGFAPSEIIEAGLATRTKAAQRKGIENNANATNSADSEQEDGGDYSTLIDRFRNRLVVPIFDARGSNVLGFGARILPPEETDSSGYKAPKYINSPESPVFQKKKVLFGQHYASEAVREMRQADTAGESGPDRGSIVVVEGYMDAVALWEAGINEVVASMGTALTMEQLSQAARTAGTHGGRIVLCFDRDEAGLNAIERLCTGSLLTKTAESFVVEILVATLPSGVKDPGEYIESKSSKNRSRVGEQFRKEVIDTAKDWTRWYLEDRLLSRYDEAALRGAPGSFSDICDRVSDFLSRFPNPAERTKRAHDIAGSLADIVSGESDSGEASNALRIQLESDLVNMVARKAGARESIERRIESVEGYSPDRTNQKVAKMTGGDGVNPSDDSSKLSSRALRSLNKRDSSQQPKDTVNGARKGTTRPTLLDGSDSPRSSGRRRRARIQRSAKVVQPPLTPHFSGFDFENPSDADWLNLPREKWKRKKQHLTLGTSVDRENFAKAKAAQMGEEHVSGLFVDDLVYFNSNDYHGRQFVTQDAVDAGYGNGEVTRDPTIFEQGVGTLVRQDANVLVDAAEEKLLRNIVKFERARMAMIHSLATSDATGSQNRIDWSQPERAWLFERLVEKCNTIPKEILVGGRMEDLRFHLSNLPDAPERAFGDDFSSSGAEKIDDVDRRNALPLQNDRKDGAIDTNSSIDEMSTPSDIDDIESWAASYDPAMFEDSNPGAELEDTARDNVLPRIEAEPVSQAEDADSPNDGMLPGCLDAFFALEDDLFAETYDASVSRELRAELEVQEAHATLLRASALRQFATVKAEWLAVGQVLAARLEEQEGAEDDADQKPATDEVSIKTDDIIALDSMSVDDLKEHCSTVATRLRDIAERVYHLDVTAKRIGSRLMDYSNMDGIEGRLSVAKQEELASMVDTHVNSLPENWKAPEMTGNRSHNNRDPILGWGDDHSLDKVECFEEDMTQISDDWGEWADDDFVWSPEDNRDSSMFHSGASSNVPSVLDNAELEARLEEDDESLEDTLHRLDSEWADWDNDEVPATSSELEIPGQLLMDIDDTTLSAPELDDESVANGDPDRTESDGELEDSTDLDFGSIFE